MEVHRIQSVIKKDLIFYELQQHIEGEINREPEKLPQLKLLAELALIKSKRQALCSQPLVIEQNDLNLVRGRCSALGNELGQLLKELASTTECGICAVSWEAEGSHRLVGLPCGHLFGENCIKEKLRKAPFCPICKNRVQNPFKSHRLYYSPSVKSQVAAPDQS
ncbi:E3 ubiquitin-protein ligase RNF181-like [Drosophila busckii]|uniref:E3 ubiquitin-protein ligase RNF181-like n=1 Tax=Drosophila busckii TaxID=30019 RepID=UPI00083F0EEA|nr:E3 ubiquitin-protein ligase RNF181-like [Drosophila busckii]